MYKNFIELDDLYHAYKKVKYELFNDKNSIVTVDLFKYEQNLESNIAELYQNINENGFTTVECPGYYELPKASEFESDKPKEEVHFFTSSLAHHKLKKYKESTLKFRKIINADINFHIISTLWITYIGQHIDSKFSNDIYGSRLVRIKPTNTNSCEFNGSEKKYNIASPRVFEPYQYKYKNWRNNSFKAIRELHKISSVVAITMDITNFYHSIKLEKFKLDDFYKKFKLDDLFRKKPKLKEFHEEFIQLLERWNESISDSSKITDGIPIGISASPILANAAMFDFDKQITDNLQPTYYGRYVDDILLVFPDTGGLSSGQDVINYLISKGIVTVKDENEDLYYDYFRLKKSKQKIFYLDKNADLSIIDAIELEINSVSSEWRFMSDIGNENSSLLSKIIGFYADGEEFNDALRKIDAATIKRLGLSLLISHSHSLNEYINPFEWREQRYKVYDLIENHIFIPQNFFNNYTFIPKFFRLMVHSHDGERAYCFLEKVFEQIDKLEACSYEQSNGKNVNFEKYKEYNESILKEVFLESCNMLNKMSKKYLDKIITRLSFDENELSELLVGINISKQTKNQILQDKQTSIEIKKINAYLFLQDLSFDSYSTSVAEYMLTKDEKSLFKTIINSYEKDQDFNYNFYNDREDFIETINSFNTNIEDKKLSNIPLIFSTRLFFPVDISIISSAKEKFKKYINYLRGTYSHVGKEDKSDNIIEVKNTFLSKQNKISVAITNFHVSDDFWTKSVIQNNDKSISRYRQITQIVKEAVLKRPNYLVLPELSIPQEWAWLIAKKLLSNNISLITGVEYIHTNDNKTKVVHNSIIKYLISDDIGFNYLKFFRQDKSEAAHSESIELHNIANIELRANTKYDKKKIYKHGNFYFSSLICNELTDIENRMKLRGNIDALFVLEWNKDLKSFNALVESASLDIHSYIVQVNNRQFGDSRIRAPYAKEFSRDIVQVRGGNHDYLIVGELNIKALRNFQSHNVSPSSPFKPVPTGFKMSDGRKKWKNDIKKD